MRPLPFIGCLLTALIGGAIFLLSNGILSNAPVPKPDWIRQCSVGPADKGQSAMLVCGDYTEKTPVPYIFALRMVDYGPAICQAHHTRGAFSTVIVTCQGMPDGQREQT